jgi:hypothetical protein
MENHQPAATNTSVTSNTSTKVAPLHHEDSSSSSPRRSGRARKTTTMKIDGHVVLRKNNYTVTGVNYVFDVHDEDDETQPPARKKKAKTCSSGDDGGDETKPAAVPRAPTVAQLGRKHHNETVLAGIRPKQNLRMGFLAKHLTLLEPFCEPKVLERLLLMVKKEEVVAAASTADEVSQPKMIQATMRDYQMRGLEFMVRMHRQNLAMILGDEMGLVSCC